MQLGAGPSAWDDNTLRDQPAPGRRRALDARHRRTAGVGGRRARRSDRRLSGRWVSLGDRR